MKININNKVGIWGFGVVGKSLIKYLSKIGFKLEVIDKKDLTNQEEVYLKNLNIKFFNQNQDTALKDFLENNDYIISSPGINLQAFSKYNSKFLTELDLFYNLWQKKIIAVTGTLGKTSIVHLLSEILKSYNVNVATGGNIGTAMLDLLDQKENSQYALLELSSFQLEQINEFQADLAIWTNFYPNHLDRHVTLEEYFKAKLNLILKQNDNQKALLPLEISNKIFEYKELIKRSFYFFTQDNINNLNNISNFRDKDTLYFIDQNNIITKYSNKNYTQIIKIKDLPNISYKYNWLIIVATLDILNLDLTLLKSLKNLDIPAHRLELISTINNIEFYNDSKSTIPQATITAIEQLNSHNIIVFIGGISKGVDRKDFIKKLENKVKNIIFFGGESKELFKATENLNIKAYKYDTLEEAFNSCCKITKPGDKVLFSPAGASFDLFKNYQERGEKFVNLVKDYKKINNLF